MSEFSQKELADFLGYIDYVDYNRDSKMLFAHFFGDSIDQFELFDSYKNIYAEQTTKNHLECYNQIRLIVFKKCLDEVKYALIDAVKNMENWSDEQFKQFVDTVIKSLFIQYDDHNIQHEKDYDDIIKSYLIYKGKENITIDQFKSSKEMQKEMTNTNGQALPWLKMSIHESTVF